jgi:predicted methyltransferase
MPRLPFAIALLPLLLAGCASSPDSGIAATTTAATTPTLASTIAGEWRDPRNVARDDFRHPAQTLAFFGIAPTQTVIELTPGAGWYTEILAPYLRPAGQYVAAVWDDAIPGQPAYRYRLNTQLRSKLAGNVPVYGAPEVRVFDPAAPHFGPARSADVVLTFRNAHNWVADDNAPRYFQAFFDVLKPGGSLGVVDHRAKPGTDLATMKTSGYLTEDLVIGYATAAGFVLEDKSEINANPRDTTDHPNGVWTLPPSNRHDASDAALYQAIGESDRMTLRFRKPAGG